MDFQTLSILICIGILAGFVGGAAGVGGGLIIVPAFVLFMGFSQHYAQGTSTATLLLPIGVLAAYNYHKSGYVNWKFALVVALAFIIGSYFGSKVALNLDEKWLKRGFSILLLSSAIKLFWDSFRS